MGARTITVKMDVLGANKEKADTTRKLLDSHKTLMINIMSASGSGKTSLIIETIKALRDKYRIAVIDGSVFSSIDADRIAVYNVPVIRLNTAGGCHLDAHMIEKALYTNNLERIDLIMVENVGNLVCTADFDLGAHKNAVILSIPEGDDKPLKYPVMFTGADVVLLNKMDVQQYFDFRMDAFSEIISGLNPYARIIPVSVKTGDGLDGWFSWIEAASQRQWLVASE